MHANRTMKRNNAGVALLAALGMLFIFCMLGMAYVGYMTTTLDRSNYDIRLLRTRCIAEGGIEAGIATLQAALHDPEKLGRVVGATTEVEFPVYRLERGAPNDFAADETKKGVAKVTVRDESGAVNLNHAPARVLQAILKVDGDTARRIRSSLPAGEGGGGPQAWLASVDDLVARGLVTEAALTAVPTKCLTVYSVADHANATGFVNLNVAPPVVLAALLDVDVATAQKVVEARAKQPFKSLADVAAAAGKDPASFNLKPAPDAPDALPKELSFQSRCFRIVSEAELSDLGPGGRAVRATHGGAEAVVVFDEEGRPQTTFWSEAPERN